MQSQSKQNKREFKLTSLAVDNSTSIVILTLMILLFGVNQYQSIPKESFPEISFPTIYVNTPYFGNSASEIENLVTRPIEQELQGITGLKSINSSSVQDYSVITAEFDTDMDIDEAKQKVKDAVDIAKSELPDDLPSDPIVLDINLSELPIMTVNLSGEYTPDQLNEYAEYLEDRFESITEISSVDIKGTREREVQIDVDLYKMQARQISFNDISNAIQQENLTMSAGELLSNGFRRGIRVVGQFDDVRDIDNIIIKSENQKPIYLRDIATVHFGFKDETSIARSDGFPVVSVDVIKRSGENLIKAADQVKEMVAEAQNNFFPTDLKVSIFNDQSIDTKRSVDNLENSIISGVILVVIVLLFFLGIRNALFVGVAIPLSMLLGILILSLMGYTLNMVVLFGLILALGLLVDNGIVVVENVYRYLSEGFTNEESSKYGTGEVAVPIIASTATTLAAFIPLAFWPGLMGEFMRYLPLTLIIVLLSSLFVALVINPVLTNLFMKIDTKSIDDKEYKRRRNNVFITSGIFMALAVIGQITDTMWLRNIMVIGTLIVLINWFVLRPASFGFQERFLPWLEKGYKNFIQWALKGSRPIVIFLGTFMLLIISIVLLGVNPPKVILFPKADPAYVNAFIELPIGTDIKETDQIVRSIESKIETVLTPYTSIVESVLTQIGENTNDPNGPPEPGVTPNKARITVTFVASEERGKISTKKIMEEMRKEVKGSPGVKIFIDQNADGPPTGKPINIEITGENMEDLVMLSESLISDIDNKGIPGIEELKADVQIGKPELLVHIDREAARRYEVSTYAIADAIRTSVYGKEVSKFKVGEDEYDIFVRLKENQRYNTNDLINQKVTFRNPATGRIQQVPISAVASLEYSSTYSAIKRKDLKRVITIFSNVLDGYNPNEINDQLKTMFASYDFPPGVTYGFTGEQEEQAENMAFLSSAFLIAVFMIFIILVTQFNSIVYPFIIILSVLFSTIGVFLGYVITGADLVIIMTGVGIISLAGVVVNNAIVLIDYTNIRIQDATDGLSLPSIRDLSNSDVKEAITLAGATRLRPVLLTAITTILGLVPLATGFNFNFGTFISELDPQLFIGGENAAIWGPMAWTVIYGMTFSTFLTLVVVPVMYWMAFSSIRWVRRRSK